MNGIASKPITAEGLATAIDASVSVADTSPVLDTGVLALLAGDIGKDGTLDVVRLFLAEAPRTTDRLQRACIVRGAALLREVHTLASAARSVGLLKTAQAAADIEHAMANAEPDADQLAELLALLESGVAQLAEWEAAQHEATVAAT
ncbi:MAG TPA: Hpt domain-containing protein [Acetobacteraceae bacterium]|jgi:HPt (histidine-containing phosphotransfer) domain-containing protein|nr:Hpt domain-containing protein [Acetobacteraceae bacterium]